MPDFYQHARLPTLHQLRKSTTELIEFWLDELRQHTATRPVTLILPALFSEIDAPALPRIVRELCQVDCLEEIVISMNRMDAAGFARARQFFTRLPQQQRWRILWNDGPRVSALYRQLADAGLCDYQPGKGSNVWLAIGYVLARGRSAVIATHDSDILSYHREMLLRLCLPVVHRDMGYEFAKSYYGRVSDRLYGRVTRLFALPLVRALRRVVERDTLPLLEYLDSFRYPLSGEFAMDVELANRLALAPHWGLEAGLLCEVFRRSNPLHTCQVDLGMNFEHKHQHLGYDPADPAPQPTKGLSKMAREVALTLFRQLEASGQPLSSRALLSLPDSYQEMAERSIRSYRNDSYLNNLTYIEDEERAAVEAFSNALASALEAAALPPAPVERPLPAWNKVRAALPDFGPALLAAVEADHGMGGG